MSVKDDSVAPPGTEEDVEFFDNFDKILQSMDVQVVDEVGESDEETTAAAINTVKVKAKEKTKDKSNDKRRDNRHRSRSPRYRRRPLREKRRSKERKPKPSGGANSFLEDLKKQFGDFEELKNVEKSRNQPPPARSPRHERNKRRQPQQPGSDFMRNDQYAQINVPQMMPMMNGMGPPGVDMYQAGMGGFNMGPAWCGPPGMMPQMGFNVPTMDFNPMMIQQQQQLMMPQQMPQMENRSGSRQKRRSRSKSPQRGRRRSRSSNTRKSR